MLSNSHQVSTRLAPEDVRRTLLRPQAEDLTEAALSRRCLRPLARLIWQTAGWRWEDFGSGWTVGDFAFLILESTVAHDATLYVQIWSEPMESVAFEVCSGEWNPGAAPFVTDTVREKLVANGFAIGGGAGNFQKLVGISSPADAEVVAKEMLSIFFDVFGFRGRTPLSLRLVRDARSRQAVVHDSLTPEDLKKLLDSAGYTSELMPDDSEPLLKVSRGRRFSCDVRFDGRKKESNLYCACDFLFPLGPLTRGEVEALTGLIATYRLVQMLVSTEGEGLLRGSFVTIGGVTVESIVAFASAFEAAVRKAKRQLRRANRGTARAGRRAARARVVH